MIRIRPAKSSKLAKTRKVLALARSMGATTYRTVHQGNHSTHLVLPKGKVWVASNARELWIGWAGWNAPQLCADIDIAMSKVSRGVK